MTGTRSSALAAALDREAEIASADEVVIDGIRVSLKRKKTLWVRRVIEHIMPDSPLADAPERMALRLLTQLTAGWQTDKTFDEVFLNELAPLRDLFLYKTGASREVPIGFHVLMAKAKGLKSPPLRTYSEKTFRLLCANEHGEVDAELIRRTVAAFRRPVEHGNLAERAVLGGLANGTGPSDWPDSEPGGSKPPFLNDAGHRFRRDLRTILDAGFGPAEFFRVFTQTVALHFALYQPQLAHALNPQMFELEAGFSADASGRDSSLVPFASHYATRVPSGRADDRVRRDGAERRAYLELSERLTHLHFSILLFNHTSDLAKTYYRQVVGVADDADDYVRTPRQIRDQIARKARLGTFLDQSFAAYSVRVAHEYFDPAPRDELIDELRRVAESGMHALRLTLEAYNRTTGSDTKNIRSRKQGMQVTEALVGASKGERFGILRSRPGIGNYFEVGPDTIPLLLLLSIRGAEKVRVDSLFERIGEFGLRLDDTAQENLLGRFKSMGLYERYSDAGDANYVRSLMLSQGARS